MMSVGSQQINGHSNVFSCAEHDIFFEFRAYLNFRRSSVDCKGRLLGEWSQSRSGQSV